MKVIFECKNEDKLFEVIAGQLANWEKRFGWKVKLITLTREPGRCVFECTTPEIVADMEEHFNSKKAHAARELVKRVWGIKIYKA